ncbi:MAG TPA: methyltransferase domain-containing protein [Xanthomonadales bacterium]|nr:methyltransferase domain-containing protein [Xanthomonadales bacterium]
MVTPKTGRLSNMPSNMPGPDAVQLAFDRVAKDYDRYAALEREVGSRLLERLTFQKRPPARILDLGCGTGDCSAALKRLYRKADVIGLDASRGMLGQLRRKSGFPRPLRAVCADYSRLPFAARTADLLFSNLALQWCRNFHDLAAEFRLVLKPDGMFVFSTLGPDSFKELRAAAGPDGIRGFTDQHDIGDALQAAGFQQAVMDSERITLEFQHFDALLREVENSGASTHFADWSGFIQTCRPMHDSSRNPERARAYPLTYEIAYGLAFGPEEGQPVKTREGDVASFSVDSLRASRQRF